MSWCIFYGLPQTVQPFQGSHQTGHIPLEPHFVEPVWVKKHTGSAAVIRD